MKATHTGRLKSLAEIMEYGFPNLTSEIVLWIINNQNIELEFYEEISCYVPLSKDDISLGGHDLTNITEIKPRVEIPETPFWVELSTGCHDVVASKEKAHQVNCVQWEGCDRFYHFGNTITPSFDYTQVSNKLNNGTWKIVDEPKKEMRPWNDEEIEEFIFTDGWLIKLKHTSFRHVDYLDPLGRKFLFNDDLYSYDELNDLFTDRHGNKFEKEAKK